MGRIISWIFVRIQGSFPKTHKNPGVGGCLIPLGFCALSWISSQVTMTEVVQITQQRALPLRQRDAALPKGVLNADEDGSHLDLTNRVRFLEATGGCPPYVLERVDAAGRVDRFLFERPFLIVGRSAACDVACQLPSLSYRHLYLQSLEGVVWCFDLDSGSGVWVEGKKRPVSCLVPGMAIRVGDYTLRLAESDRGDLPKDSVAIAKANTLRVGSPSQIPPIMLEFENGQVGREKQPSWPLENTITLLGRCSCCDIRLSDESVSRVHASLVLTGEGLWIVDLLGRGGTLVNGVPAAYAYLPNGSQVQVGAFKIRIRYGRGQSHPAEAVLNEEEAALRADRSEACGVSEEELYELLSQVAEMQQQMLDQSQMQLGLVLHMLGSIHQNPQELPRTELDRVEELWREMQDLQGRVALQASAKLTAPPRGLVPPPSGEATAAVAPDPDEIDVSSEGLQEHARLFQRMHNLDRERNSRLQRIVRVFRGS